MEEDTPSRLLYYSPAQAILADRLLGSLILTLGPFWRYRKGLRR